MAVFQTNEATHHNNQALDSGASTTTTPSKNNITLIFNGTKLCLLPVSQLLLSQSAGCCAPPPDIHCHQVAHFRFTFQLTLISASSHFFRGLKKVSHFGRNSKRKLLWSSIFLFPPLFLFSLFLFSLFLTPFPSLHPLLFPPSPFLSFPLCFPFHISHSILYILSSFFSFHSLFCISSPSFSFSFSHIRFRPHRRPSAFSS